MNHLVPHVRLLSDSLTAPAGRAFGALYLDATMSTSAALWQGDEPLEVAQRRTLDFHIETARAHGRARVLDVACGWGAMLDRLVRAHRVEEAVGLTTSLTERDAVLARGLERARVAFERIDAHTPDAPYDAIICVGGLEHVAAQADGPNERAAAFGAFFARMRELLRAGGHVSLETLACNGATSGSLRDALGTSAPPHLDELARATQGAFEIVSMYNHRAHYARTARAWERSLVERAPEAIALVGRERLGRTLAWARALAHCLEDGALDFYRVALR